MLFEGALVTLTNSGELSQIDCHLLKMVAFCRTFFICLAFDCKEIDFKLILHAIVNSCAMFE